MKKYITILIFLLSAFTLKSQVSVSYTAGYGTYKMTDSEELMKQILNGLPNTMPIKIVSNFPGGLTHNIELSYNSKGHEFGINGAYLTTGGRIAYSDYSGSLGFKLTANAYNARLMYKYNFFMKEFSKERKLYLFAGVNTGITFSSIKGNSEERIGTVTEKATLIDDNTTGFSLYPMIGGKIHIIKNIGVLLNIGYDLELGNKINDNFRQDWSGFRANIGLSFSFGGKQKTEKQQVN